MDCKNEVSYGSIKTFHFFDSVKIFQKKIGKISYLGSTIENNTITSMSVFKASADIANFS